MATAASGIGRTLARLGAISPRRPGSAAAPSDSRAQILAYLEQASHPVSVDDLCRFSGLHANTVRGHLEVLIAGGSVIRESGERSGRGRPPLLYRAASTPASVYAELSATLARQISADPDQRHLVGEAAERWAEVVEESPEPATSIDDAIARATAALNVLGFEATASPVGDSVTLGTCPYAALIDEQPVICEIHTAMLGELLRRTGQPVQVSAMEVWAAPGMCRARLARPDRSPARVIRPDNPGTDPSASGRKSR